MSALKIAILVIGILAAASAYRVYRMFSSGGEESGEPPKILVEVRRIDRGVIRSTLEYSGELRGLSQIDVYPEVPGRLLKYTVQEGEWVRKDQTIAILDRAITGLEFKEVKIKAPISGTIGYLYLDPGMSVAPQIPIAMVVELQRMKVRLRVPEVMLPKLRPGMRAHVRTAAYPDNSFPGKLERLSPVLDPFSKMAVCEVVVDNEENMLKPGMLARVEITSEEVADALLIPQEAVVERGGTSAIFKVEDSHVRMVRVVLGLSQAGLYQLIEGDLHEGDLIVTRGAMALDDGFRVEYGSEDQ